MKRLLQLMGLSMSALLCWFSPMQISHGTNTCCTECQMKKEDEITVVEEFVQEDTTT